MAPPIVRQRLSDVLVGKIHDLILEEKLNPGDRLPTEQALAEQFGVSRLAVREATKALGLLGILESSPRRGLTVGKLGFERVIPLLKIHPGSRDAGADELVATRIIVETGALPFVLQRMAANPEVYGRLHAINERMKATNDLDQLIRDDIAFHNALLEESGLRTLMAFGELLQLFFQRFRENVKHADWKMGIESHLRIIDLLRDGKLAEAGNELRSHISSHLGRIRDAGADPAAVEGGG